MTAEHPLWVEGEGWVEAGYLRNGDKVARADAGGWATVQSLRGPPGKETVYNFVVANTHTFFVGTGATWVHNGGPCAVTELWHGTTGNAASKMVGSPLVKAQGIKPGPDGYFFLAEESNTAMHFAMEAVAGRGGKTRAVLKFSIPQDAMQALRLDRRYTLGDLRGAPTIDIQYGSGFERVLSGSQLNLFNELVQNGSIKVEKFLFKH